MTEEQKKSYYYASFGDVMKDIMERKTRPWIPITYICMNCGEGKVQYGRPPWSYAPFVTTHCWNCKTQTKHTEDY